MAEQQQTSGLLAWLLGGLVVGGILLGLLIAAYEIGYHRGQHHNAAAAPPPTTTTTTTPATTPTTSTPTTTTSTPAAALAAKGKQLYTADGCSSCHSLTGSPGVGPSFKALSGSTVTLTTGQTVTATDAYLTTSIRAPDAQIVKGYHPGVMGPAIASFNLTSNAQDIAALVAFIKTQR
jgi:mono/diheme cytochrome c family protein